MKTTRLRNVKLREVSLVKRGANPHARILFFKSEEPMSGMAKLMTGLRAAFGVAVAGKAPDGTILKTDEEYSKALDGALADVESALNEPVSPPEDPPEDPPIEPVGKEGIDPDVVQLITKAQETAQQAESRALKAEERIAKMESESAQQVAIAKTETLLGGMPGNATVLAGLVAKASDEELAALTEVFKAGQAGIAAATREIGFSKAPEGSPQAKLQTLVEKTAKERNISIAKAYAEVMINDPSLYDATLAH
jgi:hypothetical protein